MKQFSKPLAIAAGIAALVVATSAGTAVASSLITSNDIQDGTIRSVDIKDTGVHHRDLGLHLQSKIDKHATKGADGARGPQGEQGEEGSKGEPGNDAFTASYVNTKEFTVPAGNAAFGSSVSCEAGDLAIGGGYSFSDHQQGWSRVFQDRPDWTRSATPGNTPDGWRVEMYGGDAAATGYLYVTCVDLP